MDLSSTYNRAGAEEGAGPELRHGISKLSSRTARQGAADKVAAQLLKHKTVFTQPSVINLTFSSGGHYRKGCKERGFHAT